MRHHDVRRDTELQRMLGASAGKIARIASFLGLIVGALLVYLAHEAIGA